MSSFQMRVHVCGHNIHTHTEKEKMGELFPNEINVKVFRFDELKL